MSWNASTRARWTCGSQVTTTTTSTRCLREAGGRPDQVVKVQVFMTDISERAAINPRRIAYFGEHRPASTLVEVKGLVDPRMKVEIEAQAVID